MIAELSDHQIWPVRWPSLTNEKVCRTEQDGVVYR